MDLTLTALPPAADRVGNGIFWFNLHRPGWRNLINRGRLDMRDASACPLGQTYGSYWSAPPIAADGGPGSGPWMDAEMWAILHGFQAAQLEPHDDAGHDLDDYEQLRQTWLAALGAPAGEAGA